MSKEFGERLRVLRKVRTNYSQEDMARLLNISRSTYTYYETGKSEPNYNESNQRKYQYCIKYDSKAVLKKTKYTYLF